MLTDAAIRKLKVRDKPFKAPDTLDKGVNPSVYKKITRGLSQSGKHLGF